MIVDFTEAELRCIEGFVAETLEWSNDPLLREIARKLNLAILDKMYLNTLADNVLGREWPEYRFEDDGPDLTSDDLYDTLRGDHDELD